MARIPPLHADLSFNSPLSDARAARLIHAVRPLAGAHVVDVGCGWGEFLLRVAAAEPTVTAAGADTDPESIAHARAQAAARGLADRVHLELLDADSWRPDPADIAICIGSSHTLGGTAESLTRLRPMVRPGGRLVFGDGFWEKPPTDAATTALGGTPDEFGTLAELVDLAVAAGWRTWDISVATQEEWDTFESGYSRGWEHWLAAHPDDPETGKIRDQADTHRAHYLGGYRTTLGFAYLILG